MMTDPEPVQRAAMLAAEDAIMQTDANRPVRANPLEMERRMLRISKPQAKASPREDSNRLGLLREKATELSRRCRVRRAVSSFHPQSPFALFPKPCPNVQPGHRVRVDRPRSVPRRSQANPTDELLRRTTSARLRLQFLPPYSYPLNYPNHGKNSILSSSKQTTEERNRP